MRVNCLELWLRGPIEILLLLAAASLLIPVWPPLGRDLAIGAQRQVYKFTSHIQVFHSTWLVASRYLVLLLASRFVTFSVRVHVSAKRNNGQDPERRKQKDSVIISSKCQINSKAWQGCVTLKKPYRSSAGEISRNDYRLLDCTSRKQSCTHTSKCGLTCQEKKICWDRQGGNAYSRRRRSGIRSELGRKPQGKSH